MYSDTHSCTPCSRGQVRNKLAFIPRVTAANFKNKKTSNDLQEPAAGSSELLRTASRCLFSIFRGIFRQIFPTTSVDHLHVPLTQLSRSPSRFPNEATF